MIARRTGKHARSASQFWALCLALAVVTAACGSSSPSKHGSVATPDGVRFPAEGQVDEESKSAALRPLPVVARNLDAGPGESRDGGIRQMVRSLLCRPDGTIDTGPVVHPAWAPPCVGRFTGSNGGATARGVTADSVRVAYYITQDAMLAKAVKDAGGCGTAACTRDYVRAYLDWFNIYYQFYGRRIEVEFVTASGPDHDSAAARADAKAIADLNPPVFAALNGPRQTGAVYARTLADNRVMCFCTVSLPQAFYERYAPYVWSWYMASSQLYIHRADYIGRRLARRPASHAGSPEMRSRTRSFGLVWFDDADGSYGPGIEVFKKQLARYGVNLATTIRYVDVAGCQTDATQIVLKLAQAGVTSVMFAGDPLCPVTLTTAAQAAGATWEWLVSGSYLTDTNFFAGLYDQTQWSRAFGVSLEAPPVAMGDWYKIYKQVRPDRTPRIDALDALRQMMLLSTGLHMAGSRLTPTTFRAGMARARPSGGTQTVARISYGPKVVEGLSMWDYTATDDMTEVWWDRNATTSGGGYRYVAGGRRYLWGKWPSTTPNVFNDAGSVLAYNTAPDQ